MGSLALVAVVAATVVFLGALKVLWVGTPSVELEVAAFYYAITFGVFAVMLPTAVKTPRAVADWQVGVACAVSFLAFVLASGYSAPRAEPDYCPMGHRYQLMIDQVQRVPRLFHCTSVPVALAAWLAGWWLTLVVLALRMPSNE